MTRNTLSTLASIGGRYVITDRDGRDVGLPTFDTEQEARLHIGRFYPNGGLQPVDTDDEPDDEGQRQVQLTALVETYTEDSDGQTVEGTHGVAWDVDDPAGTFVDMSGTTGLAASRKVDAATETVDVDTVEAFGPYDHIDEREATRGPWRTEWVAYLADVDDPGPDVPYLRAVLVRTSSAAQTVRVRDALQTVGMRAAV